MNSSEINLKAIKIIIHASAWVALPIIVPLLIYLCIKNEEIQRLSLQALLFHAICLTLLVILLPFCYILIGIPFAFVVGLFYFVTPIFGIVYAIKGRYFAYPIVGRFMRGE